MTEIYHKNTINDQDKLEGHKIKHYGHNVSSFPTINYVNLVHIGH